MNLDSLVSLFDEIGNSREREKQSLEHHLAQLVENIFKLQYWELEKGRDYEYWQTVVFNSRNLIKRAIAKNPSLRQYLAQIYPEVYRNAVKIWNFEFYIPEGTSIELEEILDKSYFG